MVNDRSVKDYQNPYVVGINKVKPHDLSLDISKESSFTLNGHWDFRFYANPNEVEDDIVKSNHSYDWEQIVVPSVWELEGYGTPYYYSSDYPSMIEKNPKKLPHVSETDNPTGVYRRKFTLTKEYVSSNTFIRFGGVKSAYYIHINGIFVGYSQDSMTTSEFDISKYVNVGENEVMLIVYKFSDGTYLEDQDMWFFGGIFRDVAIYMEPKTYIEDIYAYNTFDDSYTDAVLNVNLRIEGDIDEDYFVKVKLDGYDTSIALDKKVDNAKLSFSKLVKNVKKWNAEEPNLYKLSVLLFKGEDLLEEKSINYGFRVIEIKKGRFLINGEPILFKGVNRHDYDPDKGWAIDEKTRYEDLLIMKRNNINAVRCSHYPNPPHLYECCDKLGLYVIDEANLESHGLRDYLPKSEKMWTKAVIDRGVRMVEINKNHPSIVMWSLGNESGIGDNFVKMKARMKAIDSTRPFHYEGDSTLKVTDVLSMMYLTPNLEVMYGEGNDIKPKLHERWIQFMFQRKNFKACEYKGFPILNCEYAHCMENSLGNFEEHIKIYEKYDSWIGGFIWDFVDQSIRQVDADGNEKWLYGGDFNEENKDKYFCANGIVAADRTYHPAIYQVKHGYQYFSFELDNGNLVIYNKYNFKDSSEYKFVARIKIEGDVVDILDIDVDAIRPNSSVTVKDNRLSLIYILNKYLPNKKKNKDVIVEIAAIDTLDRPWEVAGYEVAFDEFELRKKNRKPVIMKTRQTKISPFSIIEDNTVIKVTNSNICVEIDKTNGNVTNIDYGNGNMLKSPLQLNFTRAEIDNDGSTELFNSMMKIFNEVRRWSRFEKTLKVKCIKTKLGKNDVLVGIYYSMRGLKYAKLLLKINANGNIIVDATCFPRRDMVLFGMSMDVDKSYNKVSFYGRGPYENYIDRATGYKIGKYEGNILDFTHNYMRPQENGNHIDVRWLKVSNSTNEILFKALGDNLMETSVWPYNKEELDKATHIHELPTNNHTTININGFQRGVGGDLPGDGKILEKYKLKSNKEYHYSYMISAKDLSDKAKE